MDKKGKVFTAEDLPARHVGVIAGRAVTAAAKAAKGDEGAAAEVVANSKAIGDDAVAAHCAALTERFKIVAIDPDEREDRQAIIAEELTQRILNKMPIKVKRAAGLLAALDPEIRAAVIAAFDGEGNLRNPFQPPK